MKAEMPLLSQKGRRRWVHGGQNYRLQTQLKTFGNCDAYSVVDTDDRVFLLSGNDVNFSLCGVVRVA